MKSFGDLRALYPALISAESRFECREGWIGILAGYFDEVQAVLADGEGLRFLNAQSRWGTLSLDAALSPGMDPDIETAIEQAGMRAEGRSAYVCEMCGKPGQSREGDWASASCELHANGIKAVPAEVVVYTHGMTRYVYDAAADAVVVLTPEQAGSIRWLDD